MKTFFFQIIYYYYKKYIFTVTKIKIITEYLLQYKSAIAQLMRIKIKMKNKFYT